MKIEDWEKGKDILGQMVCVVDTIIQLRKEIDKIKSKLKKTDTNTGIDIRIVFRDKDNTTKFDSCIDFGCGGIALESMNKLVDVLEAHVTKLEGMKNWLNQEFENL